MTRAQELLEEWTAGEQNGMRAKRIQMVREDLQEITDQAVPRRVPQIEAFLDNPQWRGVITRKLREAVDGQPEADSDGDGE